MRGFRACARHGGLFLDRPNEWQPPCGGQFVMLTPPAIGGVSRIKRSRTSVMLSGSSGQLCEWDGLACCAAAGPLTRPPADSSNRLSGRDRIDSPEITSRADPAESCPAGREYGAGAWR